MSLKEPRGVRTVPKERFERDGIVPVSVWIALLGGFGAGDLGNDDNNDSAS